jgi:hypothetical protein
VLAREVEDDSAGDEQGQAWRPGEQLDEYRRDGTQLLGVVEHEQQLARTQRFCQCLERIAGHLFEPDDSCDRSQYWLRVTQPRERDERGAVGEGRRALPGHLEREACFARAARPGKNEQAYFVANEERAQLLELALATE